MASRAHARARHRGRGSEKARKRDLDPVRLFTRYKTRQNGRKMTSFRGATAKLGGCVDNELDGLALHQCR